MNKDLAKIKPAIALIKATVAGKTKTGTAFYIGGKYAVTALHVVAQNGEGTPLVLAESIELNFKDAGVATTGTLVKAPKLFDRKGDWAVVECEAAPSAEPIELGSKPSAGDQWSTYGYPDIQEEGIPDRGAVRDPDAFRGTQIQLSSELAAPGKGAPLDGLSGAPCLVDGKAVGVLVVTLQDWKGESTVAATVYATPAEPIRTAQEAASKSVLLGSWASAGIATRDFVVFLSAAGGQEAGSLNLEAIVRSVSREYGGSYGEPYFQPVGSVFESEATLKEVIPALCRSRVVVFDVTGFEPAIMLLAGIRAVVRRGVTVLSVGGSYALGDELDIPFNVKDANIVSHSKRQDDHGPTCVELLSSRLQHGQDERESPYYLDLPVFDAIRHLPPTRRGVIPSEEGVLVLCPLNEPYRTDVWPGMRKALEQELKAFRNNPKQKNVEPLLGVARSFELDSSRLVTQAIYEAIRRARSCVVDLTSWSSNVLFELGVRLAVAGTGTSCLIRNGWQEDLSDRRPEWTAQCEALVEMFVPESAWYNPAKHYTEEPAFRYAYGQNAKLQQSGPAGGSVYEHIQEVLDLEQQPASRPAYKELLDSAELFSKRSAGGRAKPPELYPGNTELVERQQNAEFDRLLAAWLSLSSRHELSQIAEDPQLLKVANDLLDILNSDSHKDNVTKRTRAGIKQQLDEAFDYFIAHE